MVDAVKKDAGDKESRPEERGKADPQHEKAAVEAAQSATDAELQRNPRPLSDKEQAKADKEAEDAIERGVDGKNPVTPNNPPAKAVI